MNNLSVDVPGIHYSSVPVRFDGWVIGILRITPKPLSQTGWAVFILIFVFSKEFFFYCILISLTLFGGCRLLAATQKLVLSTRNSSYCLSLAC